MGGKNRVRRIVRRRPMTVTINEHILLYNIQDIIMRNFKTRLSQLQRENEAFLKGFQKESKTAKKYTICKYNECYQ